MNDIKLNKKFKNLVSLIYSPLDGEIVPLENIDDPIFAIKALGDGLAIRPTSNLILSPCNGVVKFIHSNNHVIILESAEGFDILIHIGQNNKSLPKSLYTSLVQIGSEVKVGDHLIQFDLDALLKLNKNPDTMIVVNNLDGVTSNIKLFNTPKTIIGGKTLLFIVGKEGVLSSPEFNEYFEELNNKSPDNQFIKDIVIINKTGLHARPAAFLANLSKNFTATITISKDNQSANTRSLIEILGLGINYNDKITLTIKGDDAKEAFNSIVTAFESGLGEEEQEIKSPNTINSTSKDATNIHEDSSNFKKLDNEVNNDIISKIKNNESSISIKGIVIYPNIVMGKAFIIKNEDIKVTEYTVESPEIENNRLLDAITKVKKIIQNYIHEAKEMNKISQAEIFSAHLEVLKDEYLLNTANEEINNGKTAEFSLKVACDKTCSVLMKTQNALLKERIADIRDIEKSILTVLSGKDIKALEFPENSIIVAEDLTPSKITSFNDSVKGVLLAKGSSTSHISIMMKNDGIPSMVSLGNEIISIPNGADIILNSKEGFIIINPTTEEKQKIISDIEKLTKAKEANLVKSKENSFTADGINIKVLGNIGSVEQAKRAYDMGGEGIGLVRSEFLFMHTASAPSENDQYQIYQDICNAMNGNSVIVRTLDVGGDKPISYINLPNEDNPIMGLRGVRNYHLNKEIFYSQIRALLRVNPVGVCKIMIPMVSEIQEVKNIKEIINSEKIKLGINAKIEIGIMVEVPSAALLSKQFAKYVDFFSIGTNDLAQYILAMDRGHDILTKHINNLNPALLKAIYNTCKGAKVYNIPVGVCGAMASELECVPILIGLGVTSLSCGSEIIPDIKALIRNLSYFKCREIAEISLSLDSQDEVKELVYKEFGKYL